MFLYIPKRLRRLQIFFFLESHNVFNKVFVGIFFHDVVVIIFVIAHESDESDYGNEEADRYGHDHRDGDGITGGDRKNIFCIAPCSGRYHACLYFFSYLSFLVIALVTVSTIHILQCPQSTLCTF